MYAIALASIVGLAVFLERMWMLRASQVLPHGFGARIRERIEAGALREAWLLCVENPSGLAAIFREMLRRADDPLSLVKEAGEGAGRRVAARLERGAGALGSVATVGPLLGLLGTVTGMIGVFQRVVEVGLGSPLEMAAGIWESLVTTAFGLSVGIPALLMHRYTLGLVDRRVLALEEEAAALLESLRARSSSPPDAQGPVAPADAS